MKIKLIHLTSIIVLNTPLLFSQPEVAPWSNIRGIRVDGELMEFEQ